MNTQTDHFPSINRLASWLLVAASAALFPGCAAQAAGEEAENFSDEAGVQEALSSALSCEQIAAQLQAAEQVADELAQEYADAPPGPEKSRLLQLLKAARARVAQLRSQLHACQHPPAALPDLLPTNIVMIPNASRTAVDAAVTVRNDGAGPAAGPFTIVFGATSGSIFRQATFRVPAGVVIQPGASLTSDFMRNIASVRDSSGTATYRFDALIDSNQEVRESNEGNNSMTRIIRDHR